MPSGAYPGRVKAFRKWAAERIDKADINNSVTGGRAPTLHVKRKRRRRRKRRKKNATD